MPDFSLSIVVATVMTRILDLSTFSFNLKVPEHILMSDGSGTF